MKKKCEYVDSRRHWFDDIQFPHIYFYHILWRIFYFRTRFFVSTTSTSHRAHRSRKKSHRKPLSNDRDSRVGLWLDSYLDPKHIRLLICTLARNSTDMHNFLLFFGIFYSLQIPSSLSMVRLISLLKIHRSSNFYLFSIKYVWRVRVF